MGSIRQAEMMAYTNQAFQDNNSGAGTSCVSNGSQSSGGITLNHPHQGHSLDTLVQPEDRKLFVTGIAEINSILDKGQVNVHALRRALKSGKVALLKWRSHPSVSDVCLCQDGGHLRPTDMQVWSRTGSELSSSAGQGDLSPHSAGIQALMVVSDSGQTEGDSRQRDGETERTADQVSNINGSGSLQTSPVSELVIDVTKL